MTHFGFSFDPKIYPARPHFATGYSGASAKFFSVICILNNSIQMPLTANLAQGIGTSSQVDFECVLEYICLDLRPGWGTCFGPVFDLFSREKRVQKEDIRQEGRCSCFVGK